ncbi:MAG: DUF882 domain-containing protein [Peptococcaceae bacterium]|nr:DUF882 domain-containing protein [Peptococcaceae bacterium]
MYLVNIYSKAKEGHMEVIEYFKAREFACKNGEDRIQISPVLLEILYQIRLHFNAPVIITSGYRTESYNKKVGGARESNHVKGIAADIVVKGVSPSKVAAYADLLMPDKGGIGEYRTFVHVDVRHEKSRWRGN